MNNNEIKQALEATIQKAEKIPAQYHWPGFVTLLSILRNFSSNCTFVGKLDINACEFFITQMNTELDRIQIEISAS